MTRRMRIICIDLFCGVGGLTHGLKKSGVDVVAGVDLDPHCRYPYEKNNESKFINKSVADITKKEMRSLLKGGDYTMLVGCAPCQPFSSYTRNVKKKNDWRLLNEFGRLVKEIRPDVLSMENVPGLAKHKVYKDFLTLLKACGYEYVVKPDVYCPDYGIPQSRRRLVLVASRHGEISFPEATHTPDKYRTVRTAIKTLPPIRAGGGSKKDSLHIAARLSPKNMKRIQVSKPGGTWRDWSENLRTECHKKESGKTYPGVYGRMEWDKPSPTMTTQCYGFGNGRFGHPTQNRAISLREAALLQTFPRDYKFLQKNERAEFKRLGRLIGNAVPVKLGEVIGQACVKHLSQLGHSNKGKR